MTTPDFVLKAAVADYEQLAARARRLRARDLPVRLELHTFGDRDVGTVAGAASARANVARLNDAFEVASLIVHVPPQSVATVTRTSFDVDQCRRTIDFAGEIAAEAVVVHRYYDLVYGAAAPRATGRAQATAAFQDVVRRLAAHAGALRLRVENIGHFSVLPRDGAAYLSGPLDHFFPWEIAEFRAFVRDEGLASVEPFIDVAHATLSANLFNRRRAQPGLTADDPRFAWITADDLERSEWLDPFDFVDPTMAYLHVSDALPLSPSQVRDPALGDDLLTRSLISEGLEIGAGALPFRRLPSRFGAAGALVVEVEPGPGETHVANSAQERSLAKLADLFAAA